MDRGAWWATVHGVAKESDITKQQQQIYPYIRYLYAYIYVTEATYHACMHIDNMYMDIFVVVVC